MSAPRRWTPRTAVLQTWHILRRDGVAAAWFGVLAETVYRRLLVVERDVAVRPDADVGREPRPPAWRAVGGREADADSPPFDVRLVDEGVAATLYANAGVPWSPHTGRATGAIWFAAFDGERAAAVQGFMPGGGTVPYLGIDVALSGDAVLLGGLLVHPACRKRRVATRTIAAVLDYAAVRGYRRAVALVLPENAAGLALLQARGFAPTGCVSVARRGPMRVAFRRAAGARTAVIGTRPVSTGRRGSAGRPG
jgi:GNAT superfamily N-acetyltransferase